MSCVLPEYEKMFSQVFVSSDVNMTLNMSVAAHSVSMYGFDVYSIAVFSTSTHDSIIDNIVSIWTINLPIYLLGFCLLFLFTCHALYYDALWQIIHFSLIEKNLKNTCHGQCNVVNSPGQRETAQWSGTGKKKRPHVRCSHGRRIVRAVLWIVLSIDWLIHLV